MATSAQDPSADWARAVMVNDRTATGSLAATDATVQIAMEAHQAVVVEITGTWVGTITPEVSADGGTTWRVADFYDIANKKIVPTTTANGTFVILRAAGLSHARVRMSAFTSGSATINHRATFAWFVYSEAGGPNATALPPQGILVGGSDGTNLQFIRVSADNADALAVITSANVVRAIAEVFGFNGTTWDRIRSGADNADAEAVATLGLIHGKTRLYVFNGTTWDRARSGADSADGEATTAAGVALGKVRAYLFNETTWDRKRGNTDTTLLASTARTATTNSADQTNYNARGAIFYFNISANPGGGQTLTLNIQGKDSITAAYYNLFVDAAQTGNVARVIIVYPGVAAAAAGISGAVGFPIPRTFRVSVTHSSTGSWTYSVSAAPIV